MTLETEYNYSLTSWHAHTRTGLVKESFYRVGLVKVSTPVSAFLRATYARSILPEASPGDFFANANRAEVIIN
jgi:hypothetical protein